MIMMKWDACDGAHVMQSTWYSLLDFQMKGCHMTGYNMHRKTWPYFKWARSCLQSWIPRRYLSYFVNHSQISAPYHINKYMLRVVQHQLLFSTITLIASIHAFWLAQLNIHILLEIVATQYQMSVHYIPAPIHSVSIWSPKVSVKLGANQHVPTLDH